jgi:DNA-binding SARP family transcriptional activator
MIRIVTLGRFAIFIDGKPLQFGRKAPSRPLALLKHLAAHGGHEFPDVQIAATLWPDKGEAALKSLAVTVHRLRHLLGDAGAVVYHDRRLALDSRHAWCDALAFERYLDDAETERALALYHGDFLAYEEPQPWFLPMRERLRERFVRASATQGERLAAARRWHEARSCYERGLAVDGLAEDLCLGLMTCLAALRQPVDGVVAYRRFERSLAAAQGAEPASATQAMYQRLMRQHR